MKKIDEKIAQFLSNRPEVEAAYGYGSGVFEQNDRSNIAKQIDLILVVKDVNKWNKENMEKNPEDYSFVGKMFLTNYGKKSIEGTEAVYIPYLKQDNDLFKIGIISSKRFSREMKNWRDTYFIAGRFQKLFKVIKSTEKFDQGIAINRKKVLLVGLWDLIYNQNKIDNLYNLFENICSLSYIGDNRMFFVENPHKVRNIIEKAYDDFKIIYQDDNLYTVLEDDSIVINEEKLLTEFVDMFQSYHLIELPASCIAEYFKKLNQEDSRRQAIKGVWSAGPIKSARYIKDKVLKRIYSK